MIIEAGHFALVLALIVSLIQTVIPFWGAEKDKKGWMLLGRRAAGSVFGLTAIAFFALMHAYALSDLSVWNVVQNSHTMMPVGYRLAATWGNHEGSMLLWILILSFWGYIVARHGGHMTLKFQARVLSFQALLTAGFSLFVLFASNPFLRLSPAAPEGLGFNPILQDVALLIHPPLLYTGYVGFSVVFCMAMAGLWERKLDDTWAKNARPYVLAAFAALTAGVTLGSIWAYYELGWGGFWFWDPVENASLMPWLAGAALLHCVLVLARRGTLINWTAFLSILTFGFSLLGTFLVRSGILTSVHSFASDPTRGIFILALFTFFTGSGFLLYALRQADNMPKISFAPLSRETFILLNNLFLFTFCITVMIGTLYPVILQTLDMGGISIGPPYYTQILSVLLLPFAFLLGMAPFVTWQQDKPKRLLKQILVPVFVTTMMLAIPAALELDMTFLSMMGLLSGSWIFWATFFFALRRIHTAAKFPFHLCGMIFAHLGVALLILGATAATQWDTEKILWMDPGDHIQMAGQRISFTGTETGLGPDYNVTRGIFTVNDNEDYQFMVPERRWYPVAGQETTEVALTVSRLGLLYLVLGEAAEDHPGRRVVRAYYHPLVLFVFIGGILMMLGSLLSLVIRRWQDAR